jgi:hypothetical protein
MALIEKVCLYYREGVSDKVYEIHLTQETDESGFRVTGYNGRRGTKLVPQSKTPHPVPFRTARYIFDNLEAAKLNHRRTPYQVASRETGKTLVGSSVTQKDKQDSNGEQSPTSNENYQATWLDALEF